MQFHGISKSLNERNACVARQMKEDWPTQSWVSLLVVYKSNTSRMLITFSIWDVDLVKLPSLLFLFLHIHVFFTRIWKLMHFYHDYHYSIFFLSYYKVGVLNQANFVGWGDLLLILFFFFYLQNVVYWITVP